MAGMKLASSRATCGPSSPFCVSGRSSPPKLMIPANAPLAIRKMRSRSLKMYQNSVRLTGPSL